MTSQLPLYLLLCFTTIVTPGAGVLYTVTGSLKYGVRYAWPCVAGNAVGVLIVSFLTAGGLGAVLAASPVLFTTLQAIDGLYLIYLGIQGLRAKPFDLMRLASASDRASESQWTLFRNAVLLQGTNPMLFLFLFALFPQFVMKESRNQKGCHWGYKQDEEEIEKCGLGSICREYKSDRTSCISPRWLSVSRRG